AKEAKDPKERQAAQNALKDPAKAAEKRDTSSEKANNTAAGKSGPDAKETPMKPPSEGSGKAAGKDDPKDSSSADGTGKTAKTNDNDKKGSSSNSKGNEKPDQTTGNDSAKGTQGGNPGGQGPQGDRPRDRAQSGDEMAGTPADLAN